MDAIAHFSATWPVSEMESDAALDARARKQPRAVVGNGSEHTNMGDDVETFTHRLTSSSPSSRTCTTRSRRVRCSAF